MIIFVLKYFYNKIFFKFSVTPKKCGLFRKYSPQSGYQLTPNFHSIFFFCSIQVPTFIWLQYVAFLITSNNQLHFCLLEGTDWSLLSLTNEANKTPPLRYSSSHLFNAMEFSNAKNEKLGTAIKLKANLSELNQNQSQSKGYHMPCQWGRGRFRLIHIHIHIHIILWLV